MGKNKNKYNQKRALLVKKLVAEFGCSDTLVRNSINNNTLDSELSIAIRKRYHELDKEMDKILS